MLLGLLVRHEVLGAHKAPAYVTRPQVLLAKGVDHGHKSVSPFAEEPLGFGVDVRVGKRVAAATLRLIHPRLLVEYERAVNAVRAVKTSHSIVPRPASKGTGLEEDHILMGMVHPSADLSRTEKVTNLKQARAATCAERTHLVVGLRKVGDHDRDEPPGSTSAHTVIRVLEHEGTTGLDFHAARAFEEDVRSGLGVRDLLARDRQREVPLHVRHAEVMGYLLGAARRGDGTGYVMLVEKGEQVVEARLLVDASGEGLVGDTGEVCPERLGIDVITEVGAENRRELRPCGPTGVRVDAWLRAIAEVLECGSPCALPHALRIKHESIHVKDDTLNHERFLPYPHGIPQTASPEIAAVHRVPYVPCGPAFFTASLTEGRWGSRF